MANFALNLGDANTGITDLRAQWLDVDEVEMSIVSTGFVELGGGQYTLEAEIPDGAKYARFYRESSPSTIYFTLAVAGGIVIPASEDPDTVHAFLYTRNASGVIVPNTIVNYQLVGVDATYEDAWDDDVKTIVSDDTGLAIIVMVVGGYYRYWIGSGRFKTAAITEDTSDPYQLPNITG